jgi:sialate O-acetylesterase
MKIVFALLASVLIPLPAPAQDGGGLRMAPVYGHNMVLQRDVPLAIRGMADTGRKVTVRIAGQTHRTRVSADGEWRVVLDPLAAGNSLTLEVSSRGRSLEFRNVAVGEVWLCSGQSNMAFPLGGDADFGETAAGGLNNSNIRLFDMKPLPGSNALRWDEEFMDSVDNLDYYADCAWVDSNDESAPSFSAVAWYFGRMLADSLDVPVGLIHNAVGGSPTESWIDRQTLESGFPEILKDWKTNEIIQDWVRERALQNIANTDNPAGRHPFEPCYLFEAGIAPLAAFPVRGVIWYQGESNAHNVEAHEKLFSLLVDNWRRNWNNPALPFLYVQLSSIDRPLWGSFRDSQRRVMDNIPDTYMAVSSDRGDSLDVHPPWKRDVGQRLGRWALNKTYGKAHVTPSGPLFRSAEFTDGCARVFFDHADGLTAGDGADKITGFEIAGADG